MSIIKYSSSIIFNLLIQAFFIFIKIKSEIIECPRETPIFISNNCSMQYCDKKEFSTEECIIKNEIVKTQWLNNIIIIGDIYFRYINFGIYSNGDMIIGTTVYPGNETRIFYGIKNNGRPFFTKDNKETHYKTIYIPEDVNGNYESESLIIKTNPDGKEHFLWVSKLENYAEMFNFENGKIYKTSSSKFGGVTEVLSMRHALIPITTEDSIYYYIFGFIARDTSGNCFIYFRKYQFKITFNSFYKYSSTIIKNNAYGNIVSCFETKNKLIICFYMTKTPIQIFPNNYINIINLNLIKFNNNLLDEKIHSLLLNLDDEKNFYKCIHLKEEVGIFAYYDYYYPNFPNVVKLFLLFMEFKDGQFQKYLPDSISNSIITLSPNDLNNNFLLNDIIAINENKICFSSVLSEKESIYIIILNIFDDRKIKIRYYFIPSFILYNFKLLFELRIHTYLDYIAFSSSICPNKTCYTDDDEHYCSLMIFSYPNGTDFTFDV